jgi:N-acetylmuramoyl-L-alanine amidase
MRPVNEIIVHCTATQEGRDFTVDTIRGWHKRQGWSDIGYHYVVHRDGRVEAGRPVELIGSHVKGRNTGTIGITYIGGVDKNGKSKDTRTPEQKKALVEFLTTLLKRYPAITKISGHNQYAAKDCPCFRADLEYADLVKSVRSGQ